MKKVILIDDEDPARLLLREYLSAYPDLVIIGEANNGVDAIREIEKFSPDLIFLDIQMPGLNGFEVIQQLKTLPQIIFSTAYDQYALKAFEVSAIDYLLKPYTKERFDKAVQKVIQSDDHQIDSLLQLTEHLSHEIKATQSFPKQILVPHKNRLIALPVNQIIRVEADKNYSRLITKEHNFLSNYGISQIESKLDPQQFIRVHRSSIINLNFVQELFKYPGSYDIKMRMINPL